MNHHHVRLAIGACVLAILLPAAAQSPTDRPLPAQPPAKAKPAGGQPDRQLQPLPEPPPPPAGAELDPSLEPQVTIRKDARGKVEEFRVRGRLYMVKITPEHGVPYYLIDDTGGGKFLRHDTYDTGIRPPMWVIHQW